MLSMRADELSHLKQLVASRRPGYGLPRALYHDELLYRAEMEAIWLCGWLFPGPSCQIPHPGYSLLCDFEADSLIIVRQDDCGVRALYNVCRPRGSFIC